MQPIALRSTIAAGCGSPSAYRIPKWKADGHRTAIVDLRRHRRRRPLRQAEGLLGRRAITSPGIEVGFGGVWVCSSPNLLFIPDARRRRHARRRRRRSCSTAGGIKAEHNVVNGLTWGPDGWLYGCNGILSPSKVGKPGTPDKRADADELRRLALSSRRGKMFEVVAHGTTNPLGLDFDDHGQVFITNCVIDHLFHVVPGRPLRADVRPGLRPTTPTA